MLLLLAIAALAQEPELWTPRASEAPSPALAMEVAESWVAWATDSPTVAEVPEYLRLSQVPSGATTEYSEQFIASLAPQGALGSLLRTNAAPRLALPGPDYARVLLGGEPALSLVVRTEGGTAFVDRVERTHCTLCSEPARAVHDLLARADAGKPVLWPNVDLSVIAARQAHHLGAQRVAALQKRSVRGGLRTVLSHGEVTAVRGNEVTVSLDGTEDVWTLVYERGSWLVDYERLPKESLVRLSRRESEDFRPRWSRTPELLELYHPHASRVPAGRQLTSRVIGAAFDPRDGTILTALFDVDRATAGVVRLDPDTNEVLDRWPTRPAPRIPIDLERWFDSWHMVLSPDGSKVALSSPGQIDIIDLVSGKRELVYAFDKASYLAWVDTEEGDALVIGQRSAVHIVHEGRHHGISVNGPTVGVGASGSGLVIVTEHGSLHRYDLVTRDQSEEAVCCGGARGAAASASRAELVVTCPKTCEVAGDRRALVGAGSSPLVGAGTDGQGVAWSPDGTLLATSAMGSHEGLLLWSPQGEPIAHGGTGDVRQLSFDASAERLLSVTTDGALQVFLISDLRAYGLAAPDPAR